MMRKYHVRFGGGRLEKEQSSFSATSSAAYPTILIPPETVIHGGGLFQAASDRKTAPRL